PSRFDVVAIGVSTGGPNALAEVIPHLPADLGVPVLVVQHMPPFFTASLAEHLAKASRLAVSEAIEGEPVLPNHVYIAPGGKHMTVRRMGGAEGPAIVGLNENPPENSCRPSVDVLFRSVAAQYEGNILGVVMTGMGSDGCEGVRAMKRRGCHVLTQSEDTCVVYGMPLAVDEAGLSDEQVPLPRLASRIAYLVSSGRTS
ncbi:MAG TPA: CheB methylesterase domain-containing protein, partial [Holophaga sp.]|nr:CheB methylesterase domain-containing protein [Holophaga sp.]